MSEGFHRLLADAAREMSLERGTTATLDRAVRMATDLIEHADFAGISLVHRDGVETRAASGDELRRADAYQYEIGEGPCVDALRQTDVVVSTDLSTDERWPRWGKRISDELGIHSSLSFRLFTTATDLGALNVYALTKDAFGADDVLEGLILATHTAVAVAATLEEGQLHTALETRRMIGEATGILRERFGLTSDQAFAVLHRTSSHQNMKLHKVAQQLVDTGRLPERVR